MRSDQFNFIIMAGCLQMNLSLRHSGKNPGMILIYFFHQNLKVIIWPNILAPIISRIPVGTIKILCLNEIFNLNRAATILTQWS